MWILQFKYKITQITQFWIPAHSTLYNRLTISDAILPVNFIWERLGFLKLIYILHFMKLKNDLTFDKFPTLITLGCSFAFYLMVQLKFPYSLPCSVMYSRFLNYELCFLDFFFWVYKKSEKNLCCSFYSFRILLYIIFHLGPWWFTFCFEEAWVN